MAQLVKFKYFRADVSGLKKSEFEQAISAQYGAVSELMNEADAYFLVYWLEPGIALRAILIADFAAEVLVKAAGLPLGLDYEWVSTISMPLPDTKASR